MFTDKATVDDLGLGTIRDAISNQLFPGTSIIQTRARYFLFIPWIFARAQTRHPANAVAKAQDMERLLIGALLAGGETNGVIGREAGQNLKTLPSAVYWGGLQRYGIFRARGRTIRQYGRLVARPLDELDFEGELVDRTQTFWIELPTPPRDFFRFSSVDFDLSRDEADWLAERLLSTETSLSGSNLLGELVRWLQRGEDPVAGADYAWDLELPASTPPAITELVYQARQFSCLANGAALLYNLLLVTAYNEASREPKDWPRDYAAELRDWAISAEAVDLREWSTSVTPLWSALAAGGAKIGESTKEFVRAWASLVHQLGPAGVVTSAEAQELVRSRELSHKRGEARLRNRKRLLSYPGYAGTEPMAFRWPLVQQLLTDLSEGFANLEMVDADA